MIRPARPGDCAAIAAIWNPIIRDSLVTFTSIEKTPMGVAELMAERNARGHAFLVAVRGAPRSRALPPTAPSAAVPAMPKAWNTPSF